MPYHCAACGKLHDELPHIGMDRPDAWWAVQDDAQEHHVELTPDTCIIDDDYFIRGVIEIPIIGEREPFGFGVWVTQRRENFYTYVDNFDSDAIGPFFGWLATEISFYPVATTLLKALAYFRRGGQRPRIQLQPTEHPLSMDQHNGISLARAWEIVHHYDAPS